jgi:23S rRNA (guanosine2251-2'-O)-methyltransferase
MPSFYVIAHNIRSLQNVGSIFRTADAFGVTKIYLTGYTGRPDNVVHSAKIAKVALGAEHFVPWEHAASATKIMKQLKAQKVKILALENNTKTKNIRTFTTNHSIALLLGEERGGIKKNLLKLCDSIIEIPMKGKKESLNVSVAFGIAAFQLTD